MYFLKNPLTWVLFDIGKYKNYHLKAHYSTIWIGPVLAFKVSQAL
jgi:hypothetical protein